MKEQVVTLGADRTLIAILCEPDAVTRKQNQPAILILNSGIVHRVGPFRLNTLLARKLAVAGYTSLRFDFSGIGDSQLMHNTLSREEQIIMDGGLVMEYLKQTRKIENIILIGLCTGADNAHKLAVAYPQVTAAIFLDGYAYPTARFVFNRFLPVLSDPRRLLKVVINRLSTSLKHIKSVLIRQAGNAKNEPDNLFVWALPKKSTANRELKELVRRKTALCYIYTTGSFYTYNYLNQFRHSFRSIDFGNQLTEVYFSEMDHTYIFSSDRDRLIQYIVAWLEAT